MTRHPWHREQQPGLLGAKVPTLFSGGWRLFWTQHGDNPTYEVSPGP